MCADHVRQPHSKDADIYANEVQLQRLGLSGPLTEGVVWAIILRHFRASASQGGMSRMLKTEQLIPPARECNEADIGRWQEYCQRQVCCQVEIEFIGRDRYWQAEQSAVQMGAMRKHVPQGQRRHQGA
eukprot:scaffold23402_cov32-Tisochrysis_lutea.AAC.3